MTYSTYPSRDAAKHYEPLLAAAESAARRQAADVSAARFAACAIKSIPDAQLTPAVVAQLAAVLVNRISASPWGHFALAVAAVEYLDEAVDALEDIR
jgi:hypothetical protein